MIPESIGCLEHDILERITSVFTSFRMWMARDGGDLEGFRSVSTLIPEIMLVI